MSKELKYRTNGTDARNVQFLKFPKALNFSFFPFFFSTFVIPYVRTPGSAANEIKLHFASPLHSFWSSRKELFQRRICAQQGKRSLILLWIYLYFGEHKRIRVNLCHVIAWLHDIIVYVREVPASSFRRRNIKLHAALFDENAG